MQTPRGRDNHLALLLSWKATRMTAYWLTFDLLVDGAAPDPLPALQVTDVDGVLDPALRAAVIAHTQLRWPGAPLQVRVGHQTMRGRILAGRPGGVVRPVAQFRIVEQTELPVTMTELRVRAGVS